MHSHKYVQFTQACFIHTHTYSLPPVSVYSTYSTYTCNWITRFNWWSTIGAYVRTYVLPKMIQPKTHNRDVMYFCTYNAQAVQYSTYFEKENFSTEKPTVGTMSRTWVYNKSESMCTILHPHITNTTMLLTRKCTVGNMAYMLQRYSNRPYSTYVCT